MTNVQAFASHSFAAYALKNVSPDMDANGLFCQVPSSDGKWYTVRCVESKTGVYASHCNCPTFARHAHCTHIETTQKYWARFYKPAPVKVEEPVKKTRKPRNGLIRKVRNGGLVKVAQPAPVAKVIEQAVQAVVPAKPDMMKAALTSNKGFSILR